MSEVAAVLELYGYTYRLSMVEPRGEVKVRIEEA